MPTDWIVYACLNLFRLYNDYILSDSKCPGGGIPLRPAIWNKYLEFLRTQSPLSAFLMGFLNICNIVEVPLEMVIRKLAGIEKKYYFVIIAELLKAVSRTVLWISSGFRKVPFNLMPSSVRTGQSVSKGAEGDETCDIEILAKNFEEDHQDSLHSYIKHRRSDAYLLMPVLAIPPTTKTIDHLRELAHIVRPLVYISGFVFAKDRKTRWASWTISLLLDIFSAWPEIVVAVSGSKGPELIKKSPIDIGEDRHRLMQFMLFLLREPFYSSFTRSHLNQWSRILGGWKILRPFVQTGSTYQKLWETVYFYTSGS